WPVRNTLDGRSDTGWAVQGWERFEDRQALFIFDEPLTGSSGIEVVMRFESVHAQHQIGRFRLGLVQVDRQRLADFAPVPDEVIRAIQDWRESDEVDAGSILKVARYAADHSGHFAVSRRVVGDLKKRLEELRGEIPSDHGGESGRTPCDPHPAAWELAG
ncbi:MAG: hypothetical protein LR011_03425, partial [Verrucomicrobia bacterium]|nr:hypothetical protein [Verrucomicrobiota bacterium]